MKRNILILAIILFCSSLSGAEIKETRSAAREQVLSPFWALAIVVIFDVADIENITGGYISLEPTGIFSTEKHFEKDAVELRLLGMAHVARKGFYQDIKDSLHGQPALMLMEGVTDEKELLKTALDYGSIAEKLGADKQGDEFSPKEMPENVEVERADLDVSDLSGVTVEILNSLGQIYSERKIDFSSILMLYLKLADVKVSQKFMTDLIIKRNDCLISHLKKNLEKHKLILIPWGAVHLPGIEHWISKEGFTLKTSKNRMLLRFPGYFKYFISKTKPEKHRLEAAKNPYEALGISTPYLTQ